ncbi:uncharacterized protein [Danio rerio]|uniref:Uncharacterized protein n=1 Tax=Danio rerio TaxID=7955 RepID=A0AC58GHQ5_DANRE
MARAPSDRPIRPDDVRSSRSRRPPAWLEQYEVDLPRLVEREQPRQHPASMMDRGSYMERSAEMTPLPKYPTTRNWSTGGMEERNLVSSQVPLYESTPAPSHYNPSVLEVIQQLQEDNRKLHSTMIEMQQRINQNAVLSPVLPPHPLSQSVAVPAHSAMIKTPNNVAKRLGQQSVIEETEEEWPPPPPPVTLHERPKQPNPDISDFMEELKERIHELELKRSSPPSTPNYYQPNDDPDESESWSDYSNTAAPPLPPPRDYKFTDQQPRRQERSYRGPKPSIPDFTCDDPREFARLRISLENILPPDATERFKYQILVDHLKFEEPLLIADSYSNSFFPYSDTMASLIQHYGQPHQLALRRIAELMDGPTIRSGDSVGFRKFALRVRALVGMLEQLEQEGRVELQCGSHVARLSSKLPQEFRANFRRYFHPQRKGVPSLMDFSEWLEYELQIQEGGDMLDRIETGREAAKRQREPKRDGKTRSKSMNVLLGSTQTTLTEAPSATKSPSQWPEKVRVYCPYCCNNLHNLDDCSNFSQLTRQQQKQWVINNRRCWRCGRGHQAAQCRLRAQCSNCKGKHLTALHEINTQPGELCKEEKHRDETTCGLVNSSSDILYLDRKAGCSQVLLKVSKVLLRNGSHTLETYAVLDDGSERTILLQEAAQKLKLQGQSESLTLRTVRQDLRVIQGSSVSFTISPASQPERVYKIIRAFTADQLGLAEHTYPIERLQCKYRHLRKLPLPDIKGAKPLLLIGSDFPHLITPIQPARLGPPGGPAAVKTRLGWTLQGPTKYLPLQNGSQSCLFTSTLSPSAELHNHVENLWKLDVLPYRNEKVVTRSRQDQAAMDLLQTKTVRVNVDGVQRYATPLLRVQSMPTLFAPPTSVLANLRNTEKRLLKDPDHATAYNAEILKLENLGYVERVSQDVWKSSSESWFIPHHMVTHNEKARIVFNCSFTHQGHNLNELLLPGPNLSSSLLGVLLRFREHATAISSDIRGMFHQVRLLPEDRPLLRFLWRDLSKESPPSVYEWQVLPFGTTCSPCCATYALQRHVTDHSQEGDEVRDAVERHFYVDNWLQSFPSPEKAKALVNKLRELLNGGGFELRQWTSNVPEVIRHLPPAILSQDSEQWLNQSQMDPQEPALGLRWRCKSDTLIYQSHLREASPTTMRNIYRVLASQYDPIGLIIPFTTRAKILVQMLWNKQREWDDPLLPNDILEAWLAWESELPHLEKLSLPRCYTKPHLDHPSCTREVHIFCDASERAYGCVGYLRTEDPHGQVEVAFITSRSRVAPKKQLSVPRLELCAALTGAQLAHLLQRELTLNIERITLWTDSTTVLTWIHSDSCRFKVFVGTRVAEIQDLTDSTNWHYVDSLNNPADDITRGKTLLELTGENRWVKGPPFLWLSPKYWPNIPVGPKEEDSEELRKPASCLNIATNTLNPGYPDPKDFHCFNDLLKATAQYLHGAAPSDSPGPTAENYQMAELEILRAAQKESFPEETQSLTAGKPVPSSSRLAMLAPELDEEMNIIRVGGRLRRCNQLELETAHPVVLDPKHPVSKMLIRHVDSNLKHPGSERLFGELRRKYWILRGREAVRKEQRGCVECQKWRAQPVVPRMADLPPARLRLHSPPFFSTGMDCFGPFLVKIGRRNEKRWGILFKCLTTRAVHIEVLTSLDTDSFLMSLRRFISRRGKPAEVLSDQGTNFKGGERELSDSFKDMHPSLQTLLAEHQIKFIFNPPSAPHFGGSWEREIRSIKTALYATLNAQSVTEEMLNTILIEIEGILNSKPLGYLSSDVADPDPVTPNLLLMGRLDPSLPQILYHDSAALSRRRWRSCQVLADRFWSQFLKNYLPALQTREKWQTDTNPLQPDTVVLIVDPQLPRALWPIGRVIKVFPGADGRIRTAEVQVKDRSYIRPTSRLIRLPTVSDD